MKEIDGINALLLTPAIRELLNRCPFPTSEAPCFSCGEACVLPEDEPAHQALDAGARLLCDVCAAIEWPGPADSMTQARQWLEREMAN
jgi:hypothetical protein